MAFASLMLGGCATAPQLRQALSEPRPYRTEQALIDVPFFAQERNHCGPAALSMALAWAGESPDPARIASQVFLPEREGTLQTDLLAGARRHGKLAVPIEDLRGLLLELDAGHPVIVLQNLGLQWYPRWHYAVAIGYDLQDRTLILHSGTVPRQKLELEAFEHTWARGGHWALLVLPPEKLPASLQPEKILQAVAALEQVGQTAPARQAYRQVLARWPESIGARVGLANTSFALKDFRSARVALQEAARIDPKRAEVWHNLAFAWEAEGNPAEAIRAARRAIETASPESKSVFEGSLSRFLRHPL